jgi:hypothetical protein
LVTEILTLSFRLDGFGSLENISRHPHAATEDFFS